MEKKLTLREIAPYLPYGLKVFRDTGETSEILELTSGKIMLWQDGYYESFKPILRPLSDLTKDEFSFIWDKETDFESIEQFIETPDLSNKFSYIFWQLLFENHFDLFGLIENDLAVDINTLNK